MKMTVSTIEKKLVLQAIQTLREINKKYDDSSKKKPLLEEDGKSLLYLQIMLKKIPKTKLIKMIKVNLPHSLVKESEEVCLITGDLDKNNRKSEIGPDVLHYTTLLQKNGITQISQVMTLRQLRTEYKPYEAKQKLLAAYDLFLADSKIIECLPRVLGRHFFGKRKLPIQINLTTSNLKQEVEKALSVKRIYISGQGNSCSSEVAYLDMADAEISENILAMAEALSINVPGSWDNIMGIYLKTAKSQAVPVYMSYESPNDIQLPEEKDDDEILTDELSTIPDTRVKVHIGGKVETVYVQDELETSLMDGSDTEICNVVSELPSLKNEYCDVEECETESTKQIKSKKDKTSVSRKRKSVKQELVSFNPSQETTSNKKVKLGEETKPAKQKKKKTVKKPLSLDQSVQQANKKGKLEEETKPVKPKEKNTVKKTLSLDQSVQQGKRRKNKKNKKQRI